MNGTHDAHGQPYTKAELYVRKVMAETANLEAPKVYTERAKRYLQAEAHGVKLNPMQIAWAEKILNR